MQILFVFLAEVWISVVLSAIPILCSLIGWLIAKLVQWFKDDVNKKDADNKEQHSRFQKEIDDLKTSHAATNEKIHGIKDVIMEDIRDLSVSISQFAKEIKS